MSQGINKVILIGHLGADPETRYLPSGAAVTTIRLATSERWKDKQSGQMQDRTEWHRVVCFNKLAEIAGQYPKKGSKIYIEGSLRTQKWQDKTTGQDRYTTEIVANNLQMLDSKGSGGHAAENFGPPMDVYQQDPMAQKSPMGRNTDSHESYRSQEAVGSPALDNALLEDDVPF